MSFAKQQYIKPVSKALIAAFGKEGVQLKATHSYQVISAAFGLWAHELSQKYEVPFETYGQQHFPGARPQFNEHFLTPRIAVLCNLDEWDAQHMAQVALDVLKQARLRINSIKVLFDAANGQHRAAIFKALKNPVFPVDHASVAVGNGELPAPPATSLHDRLQLVAPRRLMSNGSTLQTLVAEAKTHLWVYPSVDFKGAEMAYADSITRSPRVYASLGLGFCVIQPFKLPRSDDQRYTVVSPVLQYDEQQAEPWSGASLHSSSYVEFLAPRPHLADLLEHGIGSLPVLKVCPTCLELYSDDLKPLAHTCHATDFNAAQISAILNDYRTEGVTEFTTIDLIARLDGKEYEVDRNTPVNESKNAARGRFLSKNAVTFGIRFLNTVSANDKNGRRTVTARWRINSQPLRT